MIASKSVWGVVTVGGLIAIGLLAKPSSPPSCQSIEVGLPDKTTVVAEVADTERERELGLQNRTTLAPLHGMIFIFPSQTTSTFWMKNTRIPLDIIWIDDRRIVDIASLTPPADGVIPQHTAQTKANFVLEINHGEAQSHQLTIGSLITLTTCKSHD